MHIRGGGVFLSTQHAHPPLSPLVCSCIIFKLQLNVTSPLQAIQCSYLQEESITPFLRFSKPLTVTFSFNIVVLLLVHLRYHKAREVLRQK